MTEHFLAFLQNGVRQQLQDSNSANYRWTDPEIITHIQAAMDDVSRISPQEQKTTLTTVAATKDISISSLTNRVRSYGKQGIRRVEYKVGSDPPNYRNFEVWGDVLTLKISWNPVGSEDVYVWWGAFHEVTTTSTTLDAELDKLVIEGAVAYAMVAWGNAHIDKVSKGGEDSATTMITAGMSKMAQFLFNLNRIRRIESRDYYNLREDA